MLDGESPLPDSLQSCTSVDLIRMGHGQGCQKFIKVVTGCLKLCKNATCTIFEDTGCSTFADETDADRWIEGLRLFYGRQGMTISVSANQTIAGWPTCENRITYDVMGKLKGYATCKPGQYCYGGSDPIKCTAPDGNVIQAKCCLCGDGNGVWSDIDGSCPSLTSATHPNDFSAWYGNGTGGCAAASRNVWSAMQSRANIEKATCGQKRGAFTWSASVRLSPGLLTCTANGHATYRCNQMCK